MIQFLLRQISATDAEDLSKDVSPQTQSEQQCEAAFYLGEDAVAADRRDEARQRLQQALEICPVYYIERESAKIELDRMR